MSYHAKLLKSFCKIQLQTLNDASRVSTVKVLQEPNDYLQRKAELTIAKH